MGCVLLLAVATGLPLALLPEHLTALAVPMGATGGALLLALLPLPRAVQAIGWVAAAAVVVLSSLQGIEVGSLAALAMLPLGALILTEPRGPVRGVGGESPSRWWFTSGSRWDSRGFHGRRRPTLWLASRSWGGAHGCAPPPCR